MAASELALVKSDLHTFDVMAKTCPLPASGHLPPQAGEGRQSDAGD